MRFFIALEIPSENRPQFQAIQQKLHTLIPQPAQISKKFERVKLRLTDLDKIHLTLAFIGEQADDLLPKLTEIIEAAANDISPFEVTPAYIDGFPNIHKPNNLWVGVKGDIDKILLIRERIKDGLVGLNLPVDERRFTPHITIAKFSSRINIDTNLESELEKLTTQSVTPIKISSIKLFESVPEHGFHKHNTLSEVKLFG